ncbi:TPA: hypothetical protein I4G93_02930 [Enterobacter hormaechei subsp. xiangfangensis]|uniref:Uncharacterized protein n=1 Tax=Enterobacter hormaechei subsp. xiangfangensis TaxID=1296536 RepID=A0A837FG50_9ENTR|nr:hypothetical protein [Enterobacter hormaechei]KJM70342.1 hypothetical protein SS59_00425 [Enterobacter hormaechei subsp. xiangfangensis]HAS1802796.1 hypothetical protein [Enterobacter hormaechei subsp. xiangfangensis]HAS1819156.1 hypothetical protein [Enterobacter hormaechei subsp. xiangfangensis]HAS1824553.1 hypothetical protein [Enterobacter hormaechei subsp. xiangfangensis]HAS1863744.1 hypothetical protein [Enterobacter hormaechei subsp. xiangfangensis]
MSTFTKEWLLKTIAELEEERDATPGAVNEDAARALEAMKIALASLEADVVAWTDEQELRDVEKYGFGYLFTANPVTPNADPHRVIKLYAAPPVPVSVPDEATPDNIQMLASTFAPCGVTYQWDRDDCNAAADSWNACRAAMLQGADPDFREISNSSTKHFRENAETSTKCWCRTCRPVTFADSHFVVCPECGNKRCPHANDHRHACTGSNEPGQEGSAYPAAPQQEVK